MRTKILAIREELIFTSHEVVGFLKVDYGIPFVDRSHLACFPRINFIRIRRRRNPLWEIPLAALQQDPHQHVRHLLRSMRLSILYGIAIILTREDTRSMHRARASIIMAIKQ